MKETSSAKYQRDFLHRLRKKGLIKKEVWILPEHGQHLATIEKQLRISGNIQKANGGLAMVSKKEVWTSNGLFDALKEDPLFTQGNASIELIDGAEPALYMVMAEYGDLPIFINVSGEQIIAEALLWPALNVLDTGSFNDAVLRSHKYFPLSTISLETGPDGKDYYSMFGALSSASILANVVYEIEALASNVIQATRVYAEFITPAQKESK